jgi:S-adenosylmethionine uptake transporter
MRPPGQAAAFAIALVGIATYCLMDVFMKRMTLSSGVYAAMLWRSGAGFLLSGGTYLAVPGVRPVAAALRLHLVRGTVNLLMALLYFWGLARTPMAQAIALAFIAPLVALLLAAIILHEHVGRRIVLASAIAFAGVLVIVGGQAASAPRPDVFRGAVAILLSALCYAWNIILMRQQAQVAQPLEIVFFQNLVIFVLLLPAAPLFGSLPGLSLAPDVLGAAALALFSALLLAWAYRHAEASYLVATEYSGFLWGALFGFLFFGEHVSPWTTAGAALIIAGCVLAARSRPAPPAPGELP